jgi:ABC-type Fe3+-hydroxamate transport system substrate-binding protein
MRMLFIYLSVLVSFVFMGCEDNSSSQTPQTSTEDNSSSQTPQTSTPDQPPANADDTVSFTGTISYVPLEGGFFAIDADNGNKYDPMNLPTEFGVDGRRVQVYASIPSNVASFHMCGTIIEIITISAL